MKASELRIGNWVSINDGTDILAQVVGIVSDACYVRHKTQKNNYIEVAVPYELVYPIPLTEEILLKAGFTTHPEDKCLHFKEQFRYDSLTCNITLLRYCAREGESQQHSCGYPFLTDKISIQYLHQLQNLYVALTGKELEINL